MFVTAISGAIISVIFLKVITADDLPSYFPKCYLDDAELNSCLLKGFEALKPHVSNGIEEIGLPPLNPLRASKLTLTQNTPLARYVFLIENFTVTGLDNYNVIDFRYNPNTMTFYGRIVYDRIILFGNLDALGQVLSIPLEGKGSVVVILTGPIDGEFEINGKLRNERGIDYYNTTSIKVNLYIDDSKCFLDGLFDNNIYLARTASNIFNANSKLVVNVLTPAYTELAKFGIKNLMMGLTNKISYNQLFPQRS